VAQWSSWTHVVCSSIPDKAIFERIFSATYSHYMYSMIRLGIINKKGVAHFNKEHET